MKLPSTKRIVATAGVLALMLLSPLPSPAQPTESVDTQKALSAQAQRATTVYERGRQPHYTQKFDLSELPHYVPKTQLTGWIRLHGNNYLSDGLLGDYWQKGFAKFQPGVRISFFLPTAAIAFAALYYNQADLIMDHKPSFYDLLGYERVLNFDPVEFKVVTGSYDVGGWDNSVVILVNPANPLKGVRMSQLDGIFGAERDGGWAGTNWHPEWARGKEGNIRTWGQMGLTGEWADKRIHVYGFAIRYNTATDFNDRVMRSSDKWNEEIHTYANYLKADGTRYIEADQVTDAVARDPYAIAFNRYRGDRPGTRRLAIADGDGPFIDHTIENVQSRTYPLFNNVYFYTSVKPGTEMDPKVKEFIRYVLSREGQEEVQRDGKYLPLTADVVREGLKKLE